MTIKAKRVKTKMRGRRTEFIGRLKAIKHMADRVKLDEELQKDYGFMMVDNKELYTLLENAK